jgi:nickel_nikE: nickel import ATP-binding protein NikE
MKSRYFLMSRTWRNTLMLEIKRSWKQLMTFPFRFIKERLLVWLESLDVVNLPSEELLSICMILQMVR